MAFDLCVKRKENGLLAMSTHCNTIRFAPPLAMTETQLLECAGISERTIAGPSAGSDFVLRLRGTSWRAH